MKCGLIGEKLTHSYSPKIHKSLVGDTYSYDLFPLSPDELRAFVTSHKLDAFNVTIPYKQAVMQYLDVLSDRARLIGAVNTVFTDADGKLVGDNTDYCGFVQTVLRLGVDLSDKHVLVLGSGGASLTAQVALRELGARVTVISRNGVDNYDNVYHRYANSAQLIVNCTPVGMYPHSGGVPVELSRFKNLLGVIDLIYNPAKTKLIYDAGALGIPAINGLYMLVAQAKAASDLFLGNEVGTDTEAIDKIYAQMQMDSQSIVLVGMPGCGKTTVARILADKLGREVIDTDQLIAERANMSIPEIFEKYGEEKFRELESAVCAEVGALGGKVIATGGGAVTRIQNKYSLRQNATVVFIKRDISDLPTDGRPLSRINSLKDMLELRLPMYLDFSDFSVENSASPEETADHIILGIHKRLKYENFNY